VGAPTITTDPRRTGIYSTGSYWGGGGEQIDTLSGNLNFSLPLVTAQGRTGWTVPVGLAYNSQNWRQDNGANLKLGGDVGYGFGWQMQLGSITPYTTVTQSATAIDHYIYTDGSGAQYQLNYNSNGVWWSSTQGVYVWFDSNANRLHFRDGTFWVMGCTSSSGEADADTMYPTTVEDVNGNQVLIVYKGGAGIPSASTNTSARIATITDVRGPSGGATYNFSYNSDAPVPHLAGITNTIGTTETFNFTYAGAALGPPFGTDPSWAGQTTSHLATMNVPSTGNYQFTYDSAGAGELDQVTFPYGGHLRWVYQNFQYAGGRTLREVSARYLAADSAGAVEWGPYTMTHPDGANSVAVHSSTTLTDASGNGAKTWNFLGGSSPGWAVGLISDFAQKASAGNTYGITHDYYTWSQNAGGHPYISAKTSLMDEGTGNQQSALTTQAQDGFGNTTQSVVYPFNNTSTPVKTYNSSYLFSSSYAPEYIFNRLLTTTLTTGGAVKTLVNNYYDGKVAAGQAAYPASPSICGQYSGSNWVSLYNGFWGFPGNLLDPQALPFASRGQVSATVTPSVTTCQALYPWGSANITAASDGSTTSSTLTSATNFAAPTTFATQSYGQNLAYNAWLGVTSTTGLNGEQLSIAYDSYGRPSTATSPYGGVTYYSYSTGLPQQQTKTGPDGFTRTTLDGLGRTIRVERGYSASNIQSVVDTVYAPCACSPLGKIQKVSSPYPSGQSAANWTVYSYDGIGRTVSTVQPDGASTTTYSYAGNLTTVTDPAGKWKQYTNDVLGNLVTVVEPDPANQPGGTLTTSYSYDWMNHVSGVSMPRAGATQTRSFVYSDAGLLTSATNPENGTVTYTYNADNTLQDKHDAKGQDTVYSYDSQKRVTMLQRYPSGRSNAEDTCQRITYTYDTNPLNAAFSQNSTGRLTTAQYAGCVSGHAFSAADMYSYHAAGAVTAKQMQVVKCGYDLDGNYECPAAPLEVDYTYDGMGQVASVVYPGGNRRCTGRTEWGGISRWAIRRRSAASTRTAGIIT
jgi:YD repeat-containing protein